MESNHASRVRTPVVFQQRRWAEAGECVGSPDGSRTRVRGVKGRDPVPLEDRAGESGRRGSNPRHRSGAPGCCRYTTSARRRWSQRDLNPHTRRATPVSSHWTMAPGGDAQDSGVLRSRTGSSWISARRAHPLRQGPDEKRESGVRPWSRTTSFGFVTRRSSSSLDGQGETPPGAAPGSRGLQPRIRAGERRHERGR